ncbi:LOW QUALITY PROTEIN: protein mono-ADP-ribosyltransferase PARP14-like [Phascolarctos cinereus]|uniref:LOW QUALITY PROTEIN: poly [ADP-ribose] polymerase 14-like n=1 Tax=Phascolarctos cinereus TaxID=38626 RepID=A0A6P5K7Z0_PHACI|nr:LOW QUALITY PROTEIN: poly [ADP-ribose] polymerase 14-like [Phascolarctos cinereus]
MEIPGSFPLVLEGPWGPDPPKKLRNKLQCYFQSPQRSGGGECVLTLQTGRSEILLLFEHEEARQRVLKRENHELQLAGGEKLKLTVKLPTVKDGNKISEKPVTTKESQTKDGAQEQAASEDQDTKLPLERRSAQTKGISKGPETISSLVVFKNIQNTITEDLLTLLVENVSGFSETRGDFTVEIIPEAEVAVVTFLKTIDAETFIAICAENHKIEELKICASPLEVTRTILVEDLPPGVNEYYITLFFESQKNGGGPVTRVQYFPEENSALIQFDTYEVLDTILTKKLLFNNSPISMFPYYPTLGTALYGKTKPPVKLPEPLTVPMEPHLLKFLQKDDKRIGEITNSMERAHCELTWPQPNCKEPEIIPSAKITLSPSATLVSQRTKSSIIKTWSKDVSKRFSCLMSEYQVTKYAVDPVVWEAIKDSIENKSILTEFDKPQKTVVIAGRLENVQRTEPQIRSLIEKATQKIEREKQSIRENLTVCPGRFSILQNNKLEETLHNEYPELGVTYDVLTKSICLTGLATDVFKAKSEILEKLQSLAKKFLHFPPQIIQFLQQVNCETFSESLFGAENIPVVYEVEGEAVVLVGSSPQVLSEAEKCMKKALTCKCISEVDSWILNDCQWKTLTGNLNKKYNGSSKTVIIEQQTSGTGVKIIIAGCVSPVCESHQELCEFIEKNTKIEELVSVKSLEVIQYMEENKQIWKKLREKNVKVNFKTLANQRGISLSGPKEEVMRGVAMVKQTLDSIHIRNFSIDKPGAKSLFKDREEVYKMEAKRKYSCSIWLQEDGDKSSGGSIDGQKVHCKITLESGILLTVQEGDLTQFSVDVVVNAANEDLKLFGGLAAELSKAAGPKLQWDCDQIIQEKGKILPGRAVVSAAGQLPCQQVIHAVSPRWKQGHADRCVQLLKIAITEIFYLTGFYGHTSIAIPALGSGIFGFPLKECAETIIQSIKENFQDSPNTHSLKQIHLVDSSEETVKALSKAVKNIFKDLFPNNNLMPCSQLEGQETNLRKKAEYGNVLASIQTREGLSILLMKGDIQDAETDIIVNSISSDPPFNGGELCRAILKKAGPSLQAELNEVGKRLEMKTGSVLLTSGCNLNCIFVLHAVIPVWDNGKGHSQKVMEDIVRECLDTPEILSLTSVTFPAIGTGVATFPKTIFAELILSQVFKFSCTRPLKTLKEVHILLQATDIENIKAFSDEFIRWDSRNRNGNPTSCRVAKTIDRQDFFGTISNTTPGVYETTIGSISFVVASGNITEEQEDVIVNSTSETFNHKGGVSKAILEAAGPNVELECERLAKLPHGNFIITRGGNLKCQKIIHVVGHKDVKDTVSSVLQECEQMKSKSVALPLIGTGNAKQDPDIVAKKIIDAVEDFAWKGSAQSVKNVKVVVFLPQLLKMFYGIMKKREGSVVPTSLFSKLKVLLGLRRHDLVFGKKIESTVFQICGESEENIENTVSWIQDLILKEQKSYTSSDEAIQNFGEEEFKELNKLQRNLNITISPQNNFCLQVVGLARDVLKTSRTIEYMIQRVQLDVEK